MNLPPPKAPSIPEGQKPADEVKMVGKPLMFKPLSVTRKPVKKKKAVAGGGDDASLGRKAESAVAQGAATSKKVSLFSLGDDETPTTAEISTTTSAATTSGAYEPLFSSAADDTDQYDDVTGPYDADSIYDGAAAAFAAAPAAVSAQPQSLTSIVDDLNLSRAERRALFGREGGAAAAKMAAAPVRNLNMDAEYQHNEELRASGEALPGHRPVRAVMPGKHSLRQLVASAQGQREALEETFARNRSTQKEASGRYGWR